MDAPLSRRRRLIFSLVVGCLVLLCIEAMLQAFYYATAGDFLFNRAQPPIFETDPLRCYRVKPNLAYRKSTNEFSFMNYTNALGLRTTEARETLPYEKRPGVTRILLLGPSFAYGWGSEYEETYAYRIAEGLRAAGHEVELLNLGTPAQGSSHQLCWLVKEGYRYHPDVVLQTDYGDIGEVADGCPEELRCPVVEDGALYRVAPTPTLRFVAVVKNLATVFYGYYLYHALVDAPGADDGSGKELHAAARAPSGAPTPAEAVRNYERYAAFVRSVLGEETVVAFVYLPLSYVAHPEDAPRWWSRGEVDPEAERRHIAEAVERMRARGLVVVDPTPALVEAARGERLYYWLDNHLTPAGNRVVAEAALPILEPLFR